MRRFLLAISALITAVCLIPVRAQAAPRLQDTGEKLVIVIDPGHGGENLGTIEGKQVEKYMTMVTALAMYQELMLYEGVEVYLTHTLDVDMDLEERAEFAASVGADFLFSVHYNASGNHELFGSEVWVSVQPPYNGYGYQFGYEFLSDMNEKGLFVRGVKARPGTRGDYYGIIRHSVERNIPAVIIEHCHVDEARDAVFCDDDEKLKAFGRADATAAARYFGLKSSVLGVDYSDFPLAEARTDANVEATVRDETAPDYCRIEFVGADYDRGVITIKASAADSDSMLLYYSYSIDGGITFQRREVWPGCDVLEGVCPDTVTLEIPKLSGMKPQIVLRVYNMYDLYTDSNCYVSQETFPVLSADDGLKGRPEEEDLNIIPVDAKAAEPGAKGFDPEVLLKICLVSAVIMGALIFASQLITYADRRRWRLQCRKEAGRSKNQQR